MTGTTSPPAPLVELRSVHKRYGDGAAGLDVLKDVSLSVRAGEFIGVVGASGSGKTTLLNILGCLDRPSAGEYWLQGREVSRLDDDELSATRNRRIGFVFQSFQLIPQLSVAENVEVPLFYRGVPRAERHARAAAVLEAVGLGPRSRHLPAALSGGESQRAAIARALVGEPDLILADEPTGNLDTRSGVEIMRLLRDLNRRGRTVVLITHNPEIAGRLPRVVHLHDGELREEAAGAGGGYEF